MEVGDKVTINPQGTNIPKSWEGRELTGTVLSIPNDGTIAVEVDNGDKAGHNFGITVASPTISSENGWWFAESELSEA